jgi:hypothetical protein
MAQAAAGEQAVERGGAGGEYFQVGRGGGPALRSRAGASQLLLQPPH